MNTDTARYLWVDLEMTGLDVEQDLLLEVAAIVTDVEFVELARYHTYIENDQKVVAGLMAQNDFWAAYPENRDHFLQEAKTGLTVTTVDEALCELVKPYMSVDTKLVLAGNSVHADRRFIERWLLRTTALLHYRQLDVSSWKVVMESLYGVTYQKAETHRALADIKESIAELQYYLTFVNVNR